MRNRFVLQTRSKCVTFVPMPATLKTDSRLRSSKARTLAKGGSTRLCGALSIAEERGLLTGPKTLVLRSRLSPALVAEAKRKSGITSDSQLLEAALANIAVQDDYWEWLSSRRGSIDPDIDLEL